MMMRDDDDDDDDDDGDDDDDDELSGTRLQPCRHQTSHQTFQSQYVLELGRASI